MLFGYVAEKPDREQEPIPDSVNMVAWHYNIIDPTIPGSGTLQWQSLEPHAVAAIQRMKLMRRHRLGAALHELQPDDPLVQIDWSNMQTRNSKHLAAMKLVDMIYIALTCLLLTRRHNICVQHDIVPELVLTHCLDDADPSQH